MYICIYMCTYMYLGGRKASRNLHNENLVHQSSEVFPCTLYVSLYKRAYRNGTMRTLFINLLICSFCLLLSPSLCLYEGHVYTNIHTYAHKYMYTDIYYICMHVHTYIYINKYKYTNKHIYIYIYIYI